jgi:IclR family mhp operon transcriptional activator
VVSESDGDITENTRPIRAIQRGLQVLGCLNERDGMTVSEVAELTRLPRTTAYRVLETLRLSGYIVRDTQDDRYRPTILVRRLAEGFEDQAWIRDIGRPLIHELGRQIVWPLSITTLAGSSMLLRETTDKSSPLVLARYAAGNRVPVMVTGAGQVYLAFCSDEQRETLLRILQHSEDPDDAISREREVVERIVREARTRGYATNSRPRHGENSLSVPILADGQLLACLTMRYIKSAMTPEKAVQDYLARLQDTARKIAAAYLAARANGKA